MTRKSKMIIGTNFLMVSLSSWFNIQVFSQYHEVKIGDMLPALNVEVINTSTSISNLSLLKGKPTILYMWSVYCKGCVASFPKIDSLQKKYAARLNLLTVSYERREKVQSFSRQNNILNKLKVPAIVNDSVLFKIFPGAIGVPHIIWIDANGIVKAITDGQYLREENIRILLDGEEISWPVKKMDKSLNYEMPLFNVWANEEKAPPNLHYLMISDYIEGVATSYSYVTDTVRHTRRFTAVNQPIPQLYYFTWFYTNKASSDIELRLNSLDTSRFIYNMNKNYYAEWIRKNAFCFESVQSLHSDESAFFEEIRRKLDSFFGLKSKLVVKEGGLLRGKEKSRKTELILQPGSLGIRF